MNEKWKQFPNCLFCDEPSTDKNSMHIILCRFICLSTTPHCLTKKEHSSVQLNYSKSGCKILKRDFKANENFTLAIWKIPESIKEQIDMI